MVALGLGGCGGGGERSTRNNFLPVHCLDKPDPGPCKASVIRYFYDYRSDRCYGFRYGGCGGWVPFETLAACEETCSAGGP
ncbi:BPTI/Kunitz domain-containing protein [Candidatus Thiosymbion oneisti]|uniref:BPTI/Kunitz domain-containing protein n=1 Tax=Candidatus Thiosymbion oneisti TaxID=589554 RepID=UPI000B7DE5D9|nr:BPTI/Kunitz domain-containing protein [Candidatus Thiosymbion oneisti]